MKLKFHATNTELHMSREEAAPFIAAGLAVEVIAPGSPKEPTAPACDLRWTLGASTSDERVSVLKYHCPVCGINGTGLGVGGAKQLAAKPPYHRGKLAPPPPELVQRAYGRAGSAFTTTMTTMQAGYQGSSRPWEYTDMDRDLAQQGKTPQDRPATGLPAVYLGNVNDV